MQVRQESPEDRDAIAAVHEAAFGTPVEARLVAALRTQAWPVISLVAGERGVVLGHVMFTPAQLSAHPGLALMALGPLAVLPAHQRRGVGVALVRAGLAACRERDADAVVVVGHPDYYPRFGFVPASRYGLTCEFDVPEDSFMVAELSPGSLDGARGKVRFHGAFSYV